MIGYNDFARAAFDNDSRADEGHFLAEVFNSLGTSESDVRRAAEQRALRLVIIERGPEEQQRLADQAYARQITTETLTEEEHAKFVRYSTMWIDGCAVTLKAVRQHG